MKHIFFFLGCLMMFLTTALTQTEEWRIPGYWFARARGDNNSIYLGKSTGGKKFMKVLSNGTIAWQMETSFYPTQFYYINGNIYFLFRDDATHDSIVCYSSLGNRRWGIRYQNEQSYDIQATTDQSGNLYVFSYGSPNSILKYDASGSITAQLLIPALPVITGTLEWPYYDAPFIDAAGNLCLVVNFVMINPPQSIEYREKRDHYYYLLRFNSSGALLSTTKPWVKLYHETTQYEKHSTRNASYVVIETQENPDNYFYPYEVVGGKMIYTSFNGWQQNIEKRSGTWKVTITDFSEWRIMLVDGVGGKAKMFKYKGKGMNVCQTTPREKVKDDYRVNFLGDFKLATSGVAYLSGTIANGKSTCGVNGLPPLESWQVLMKLDLTKLKPVWVKSAVDQPYLQGTLSNGQALARSSNTSLLVYNPDGSLASRMLYFDDSIQDVYSDLNTEDGYVYMRMWGGTGFYLAKYALPTLEAIPGTAANPYVEDQPNHYRLAQNYPNPFNPTTTIEFELKELSTVTLKVYNTLGQEVATLFDHEAMDEGVQSADFNASQLSSGVYFYRLMAQTIVNEDEGISGETFTNVKKMLLLK